MAINKFVTAICVLLLIAIVWMWVRSNREYDQLVYVRNVPPFRQSALLYAVTSDAGRCRFAWQENATASVEGFRHGTGPVFVWTGDETVMNRIGFGWGSGENVVINGQSISYESLVVPYWAMAVAVTAVPGLGWLARRRRSRRLELEARKGRRTRLFDRPWVRHFLTPVTALVFALLFGFCAFGGIVNLIMMAVGWIPPRFGLIPMMVIACWGTKWMWGLRRRLKRRAAGLCEGCGYDLRGNPGGRCPECGEIR